MNEAIRGAILQVHRWSGLTVGLLLIFLAVTGLGLVFRPQLEPIVERRMLQAATCEARAPVDTVVARATAAHPGQPIEEVEMVASPRASIVVRFDDRYDVFVDPCAASVVAGRSHWGGVFGTLEQLHRFRFLSSWTGDVIGGTAAAFLLVVFVAGGLTIWWPASRRALKSAFKLKWRLKGRAFELNLHRTTGIYVCVVLLAVASSALPLAFKPVRNAIFSAVGSPMPAPKPAGTKIGAGTQPASMEGIVERAKALVPGAADIVLTPPRKDGDAVEVFMVGPDEPHANARSYAWFDAATGKLLRFEPYASSSTGNKVHRFLSALHMGYIGGALGQMLLFLGVLGIPVLGYTGIASYLRGRRAR